MLDSFIDEVSSDLESRLLLLKRGEVLFQQGDLVESIYFLKSGRIKLVRNTIEGTPVVIHVALSGETFSEASLFSSNYHCSAIAEAKTAVSCFRKSDILGYLDHNPAAMKRLLAIFARQVRDLRTINEIKNIRSAKERTLAFIQCQVNDDKEIVSPLSLKDMAYRIGLAHETLYRELSSLEKSGDIKRVNGRIILL